MVALITGIQYGLSSRSEVYENKSVVFVKLTDSSLRAIEDYLCNRQKSIQKPKIQFIQNEGQLHLPSGINHRLSAFTFSFTSNQDLKGSQGGFECIQQICPRNLKSLGSLPYKIRIQAKDDVYETTKHRMAVAEENSKNKCTRIIKASATNIGRRVKAKSNNLVSATFSREPFNVIPTARHNLALLPSSKMHGNNNSKGIQERSLRERLIHLLALKSYTKSELFEKIYREGIKEKERRTIFTVLKQIAYFQDNVYHLQKSVFREIMEEWPFYTQQEKELLKKRVFKMCSPPSGSEEKIDFGVTSAPTLYSESSSTIALPETSNIKRVGGGDCCVIPAKRQRISHYVRSDLKTDINKGPECPNILESSKIVKEISSNTFLQNDYLNSESRSNLFFHVIDSVSYESDINNAPIKSAEERNRYKSVFNSNYEDYRKLHVQIVEISDQFTALQKQLKQFSDSHDKIGYEAIKNDILEKYKRNKSIHDRFYYLHDKLGLIKKLVSDYDSKTNCSDPKNTSPENANIYVCNDKAKHS